jgi:uncharacterized protein YbcC (UPF0753/DUF2309 family)
VQSPKTISFEPGLRERLEAAVRHFDHLLPGQAPILNFVHHNTLHGFEHLPFEAALETAERLTGVSGYLPEDEFRKSYASGRITDDDLNAVLADAQELSAGQTLMEIGRRTVARREVYRIAMVYGIEPVTPSRLSWLIEEQEALDQFQADVPAESRHRLLASARLHGNNQHPASREAVIRDVWAACLEVYDLAEFGLHPEELIDLSSQQAKTMLDEFQSISGREGRSVPIARRRLRSEANAALDDYFDAVGKTITLRGLILGLTGRDVLDEVRPQLARFCAAHMDEGLASWHAPDRKDGLYAAWRRLAPHDIGHAGASDWGATLAALPEDSLDAVIAELSRLGLPEAHWEGYLRCLALELPGWSGMVNWRQHHPGYEAHRASPVSLTDYLAIRLFLDGRAIERISRDTWGIPGTLPAFRAYFGRDLSEFWVRRNLFSGDLPEYLADGAQRLMADARPERRLREEWQSLADLIFTWRQSARQGESARPTPHRSAWRLFRLAQHLGLCGGDIRSLGRENSQRLLAFLDELPPAKRGYLWLRAYERHYRELVFNALADNDKRGRWAARDARPEAQLIFCMDDREEGIRRHLEELNPQIETLGAAGFFGVAINWRGLDDAAVTPLCPVVVTPAHEVREMTRTGHEERKLRHDRGRTWKARLVRLVHGEVRRNLASSHLLIDLFSPGVLLTLVGKVFFPSRQHRVVRALSTWLVPPVATQLTLSAEHDAPATAEKPRLGFTDDEKAERVAAFLRNTGLTHGFAPLVVLMGHGSISQNNPHLAAYDCGACSGRHGGPNARAFAVMANDPPVRRLLDERGIVIPDDTWFLGAEHNTCNEEISWFDREDLPAALRPAYGKLDKELQSSCQLSAHERCRRLASAPRDPSLAEALHHIAGRAVDFSQARPELGHATNAAAIVGRRSLSQGVFFDRRVFLISYDPTRDPRGTVLEGILLAVGPVGAGINLEYYFSTVNNDRFGCGTKVPHNVTGLFGVMEGASSDLRTGLPRQMIEIHEAMRLLLVVEQKTEVLSAIYQRQPPIQALVGNGWLQLAAKDPYSGEIALFEPGRGFVPWNGPVRPLPRVKGSADWYGGHTEPLPPARVGDLEYREEAGHD